MGAPALARAAVAALSLTLCAAMPLHPDVDPYTLGEMDDADMDMFDLSPSFSSPPPPAVSGDLEKHDAMAQATAKLALRAAAAEAKAAKREAQLAAKTAALEARERLLQRAAELRAKAEKAAEAAALARAKADKKAAARDVKEWRNMSPSMIGGKEDKAATRAAKEAAESEAYAAKLEQEFAETEAELQRHEKAIEDAARARGFKEMAIRKRHTTRSTTSKGFAESLLKEAKRTKGLVAIAPPPPAPSKMIWQALKLRARIHLQAKQHIDVALKPRETQSLLAAHLPPQLAGQISFNLAKAQRDVDARWLPHLHVTKKMNLAAGLSPSMPHGGDDDDDGYFFFPPPSPPPSPPPMSGYEQFEEHDELELRAKKAAAKAAKAEALAAKTEAELARRAAILEARERALVKAAEARAKAEKAAELAALKRESIARRGYKAAMTVDVNKKMNGKEDKAAREAAAEAARSEAAAAKLEADFAQLEAKLQAHEKAIEAAAKKREATERKVQLAAMAREKQAKGFARIDLTTEKAISPSFAPPSHHFRFEEEVKSQAFEKDDAYAWKYDDDETAEGGLAEE